MATLEDIMLTIGATDNASNVFQGVGNNAQSMASNATQAINSMNTGLMNLSNVSNNLFSKLSQGKSASDLLLGTTSKAETNAVLVNMMTQTADSASKLNKHIDDVTNTSLVSMQSLIPAMNAFKSATGATDDQIYNATEGMAQFGAKVLAQTGSVELAEQAMMNLSKGIKGAFASLDQYGISEDALMRTGLWSGKEDDIEGYIAAIQQLTGDTSQLMQTNEGLDARLGKAFSSAGKKIGNEFLPQIKSIKQAFLDLNSATGGDLAAGIIVAAQGIDMFSQSMMIVGQTSQGIKGIKDGFSAAKTAISTATDWLNKFRAAEEAAAAVDAASSVANISPEIGAAAAHAGAGFGYAGKSSMEEIEKYAGTYKNTEKQALELLNEAQDSATNIKNAESEVLNTTKGMGKVTKTTEEVVEDATKMGGVGSKAAVAGAEMEASAGGLSAISAGASSMLVPLLSIAVVIAVMIPVVTALAAEALLCIKGIQLLVDALDFGGVNLEDDIKGIKQTGEALLQIGIAMGEMTFASIMTGANLWVTGLFMVVNPIQVAVIQLKTVVPIINQLGAVSPIDKTIPGKLKSFSESMRLISDSMNSTTQVTGAVAWSNFIAWAFNLGNVSNAIKKAKDYIVKAAKEISAIKDLPEIDESAIKKLESVSKSLKATADAVGSTADINWAQGMSKIFKGPAFNGGDLGKSLREAKTNLYAAAEALKEFANLPDVPANTGQKLKSIADSLKSTKDALGSIADINWAQGMNNIFNGPAFNGGDIVKTLTEVKTTLTDAANVLKTYTAIPNTPKDVSTKVKNVADATKAVGSGIKSMQDAKIPEVSVLNEIPTKISAAKTAIINSANSLKDFNQNIPDVPADMSKVTKVADATKVIGKGIQSMINANIPEVSVLTLLPTKISTAKNVLQKTANELNGLQSIPNVNEGLSGKISGVGTSAKNVGTAVSAIQTIGVVNPLAGIRVQMAVNVIKSAASELNKLSGTNVSNVSGVLSSVRNTMNQLRTTLASMRGSFTASSIGIGAGIKTGILQGLSGLPGQVNSQASSTMATFNATMTAGATTAGNSARTAFQGSFKLADIARAEMNYAVQAVNSGSGALADACRRAAEQAVQAARDGAESNSPGAIARMWGQEIGEYSVEKIKIGASVLVRTVRNISRDVVNAWGSPSLDIGNNLSTLSNFTIGSLRNMGMLSQMIPAMNNSNKTIIFNVQKGAWQLDARNLTEKECQKIVTLGLEGLTQVSDVNIRGI